MLRLVHLRRRRTVVAVAAFENDRSRCTVAQTDRWLDDIARAATVAAIVAAADDEVDDALVVVDCNWSTTGCCCCCLIGWCDMSRIWDRRLRSTCAKMLALLSGSFVAAESRT